MTFLGGQTWGMQESCDGTKENLEGLCMPDIALKSWNQNLLACLVSSCSTLKEGMIQYKCRYMHLKYLLCIWESNVKGFMEKYKEKN